ncbi:MAG: DNA mismatch repair protein MutS [Eubacteriales bacterium]
MPTPMMQQYLDIKDKYREYILMYRVGDFYEMFYDDAKTASRELDLVLTGKDCGEAERAPMCGVPFHAVDPYIGKLVGKGYKVAICEQTEDPALAKGLVKRDVIRMITPGTLVESSLLDEKKNNYICAIYAAPDCYGIAFADISTGQISATWFDGENRAQRLLSEIGTYAPREAVLSCACRDIAEAADFMRERLQCTINEAQPARFEREAALAAAEAHFSPLPDDFTESNPALLALGGLISYVEETQKTGLSNMGALNYYRDGQYLEIDVNTRRNLELCETMRRAERKGTLLWVLDKTKTAAGARLLRKFIDFPLKNPYHIERRLDSVEELYNRVAERGEIAEQLSGVMDLERLITRIVYGTANARDLRAVAATLAKIPPIRDILSCFSAGELPGIYAELDPMEDLRAIIEAGIKEDPPFSVREGGIIRDGYNADVDYLRSVMTSSKTLLDNIEATEKEATGIRTLKVGYNRVFGYYIEVSKSFASSVPERYIRKQTLANCERYITEELKDMETQILGAGERVTALEYQLFTDIRLKLAENVHRIQKAAYLLSKLDVFLSLAEVAQRNGYVKPTVDYSDKLYIKDGRHPVVEQTASDSLFIPNDTELDLKNNRFALITGPNMAGKSTYMRQVALICIMAQIGSFVPAKEAHIGVVDKIFTRVGASDDLAMGKSTFMLEMSEVAYILANATKKSLIIYDEIGRGTSTFDGMSIARAVAEYTVGKIGAKTLFATHYHELTTLEDELEGVVNYNIAAKKKHDDIVFLRKIVRGAADDSYGIEVAKLAGVPSAVVKRAKEILATLDAGTEPTVAARHKAEDEDMGMLSLETMVQSEIADKLSSTDINTLTPLEALNLVYELKKMIP